MILKESVIDNWATALTNIAIKDQKISQMLEQAHVLIQALKGHDDFCKILTFKTSHDEADRVKIIDETFAQFALDVDLINAFKLLVKIQAFASARDILKKLRNNLVALDNATYGVVWSTELIDLPQLHIIETKISHKINKKVKLINKIDANLIGGVQVIVHNKVFDGSIRSQLDLMKYQVLKNKQEAN